MKRQQAENEILVKKLSTTNRDLIHANQLLLEQSVWDRLTGLYNHSYFQQTLVQLCAVASRSMRPLSLLFIDLDNFIQINDLYGHAGGDQVPREIGWHWTASRTQERASGSRATSPPGTGGEFALILPDTSMDSALSAAERLPAE